MNWARIRARSARTIRHNHAATRRTTACSATSWPRGSCSPDLPPGFPASRSLSWWSPIPRPYTRLQFTYRRARALLPWSRRACRDRCGASRRLDHWRSLRASGPAHTPAQIGDRRRDGKVAPTPFSMNWHAGSLVLPERNGHKRQSAFVSRSPAQGSWICAAPHRSSRIVDTKLASNHPATAPGRREFPPLCASVARDGFRLSTTVAARKLVFPISSPGRAGQT